MVIEGERHIDPETLSFILLFLFALAGVGFLTTHSEAMFDIFIMLGVASVLATVVFAVLKVRKYSMEFRESIRRGIERQKRIAMLTAEIKQKLDELEALIEEAKEEEKRELERLKREYEERSKQYLVIPTDEADDSRS